MTSGTKNSKYGTVIRYFLLATVCMLLLPLFSYGDIKNGEQSDVSDTPFQKKQLKTIIVDDYSPYTFVNQNGEPDGFSVDLIRAVAQEMGLELEIVVDTWELARNALKNGDIDLLPMMAYSKERDQVFDFSVPHTIAYDAFFTKKNGNKIRSLDDLHGKKIIVMKDDQAHDYLRSTGRIGAQQFILVDSLPDALSLLASGKGDAALMPKLVGLIVAKNMQLKNLELSPIVIEDYKRPFSFAVAEGNQSLLEKLSQGLSIVKTSNQYSNIYEKWFSALEPPGVSLRTVLKYIGGIILVFIVIGSVLLLWSFSLRRQVALRTRTLNDEITERKQVEDALRKSEEKFATLFHASPVYIAFTALEDGHFLEVNDAFTQITGYQRKEVLGRTPIEIGLWPGPEERSKFIKLAKKHGGFHEQEVKFLRKNGEPLIGLWSAEKIELGAKTCLISVLVDLTERRKTEAALQESQEKLARAKRMEAMGLMAGGIAHDLNNILSGIVSYPELLLMDLPEDSPMWKPIKTIQESGMRAADVVTDLMTIARGVATSREVLNFNTVVDEYLNSTEHRNLVGLRPSVTFKTQFASDLLNVNGSPTHIKKILMNLVTNASEAIESSGTVIISTMNQYLDEPLRGYEDLVTGEYVMLAVSDDGLGLSQQDLARIFEPFYTKKVMDRSGTGLGLAVVWNTVQDHNGYIDVKSSERGTVFELYFPVTREEVAAEKEEVPLGDYLGHGEKILVVDDEERQREIATGILTRLGYNAETVSSGEDAIEYLKEKPVDLVVLDMVMPKGINGRETYEEIIKIRPKQKAIIASGYAKTKEVDTAQELGAGKYIKKPYTLEKIGLAVKKELEK